MEILAACPRHRTVFVILLTTALLLGSSVVAVGAAPTARLRATFTPERLGAGTTIALALSISAPTGVVPPALRELDIGYPENLGIATSGLGVATCDAASLEIYGPSGCPSNSVMGHGQGVVEVPFGPEIVQETIRTTTVMGPIDDGNLSLLFYVDGESPISAQMVVSSFLLPNSPPFGGLLAVKLPSIASVPETPSAALVKLVFTLGPSEITYYEHRGDRKIPYTPKGILLPSVCPRYGFQFIVALSFDDGTRSSVRTAVPCPPRQRQRRRSA